MWALRLSARYDKRRARAARARGRDKAPRRWVVNLCLRYRCAVMTARHGSSGPSRLTDVVNPRFAISPRARLRGWVCLCARAARRRVMAAEVQVQQQQQTQQQNADYNPTPLTVQSAEGLEHCSLLGGTFAIFVQCALAAAAIGTLVYKRHSEKPQRPWRVWFFDASKQAYAGFLQHMVNIAFGMWFASSGAASECAWYAVNFTISVVCGVFLLWGAMRLYARIVERFRLHYLRSGEYGNPPSWRPWLAQLLVWGFLASGEKVVTAVLVIVPLHPLLDSVAVLIERPFLRYPRVENSRPEAPASSLGQPRPIGRSVLTGRPHRPFCLLL